MSGKVLVAGAGMAPFQPLGSSAGHATMAGQAIRAALTDARIDYELVDQVFTSCVHGGAGIAVQALSQMGYSGLPVFSLGDACVAASSAFELALNSLRCGQAECVLVVGVECMPAPMGDRQFFGFGDGLPVFGQADEFSAWLAQRLQPMQLFTAQHSWLLSQMGVSPSDVDQVLARAGSQAALNPCALLYRTVQDDGRFAPFLCPPACGAAATVLCTPAFALRFGAPADVQVLASARGSDCACEQESACVLDVLGRATTRRVAQQAYQQAGLGAEDIDVAELHDQSVADAMVNSAALGFCREEEIARFVQINSPLRGQMHAINPSGGLLGRGHAPGASGLAQLVELVWQLRERAPGRQIDGVRTALQHSSALGRAVSVNILQRT